MTASSLPPGTPEACRSPSRRRQPPSPCSFAQQLRPFSIAIDGQVEPGVFDRASHRRGREGPFAMSARHRLAQWVPAEGQGLGGGFARPALALAPSGVSSRRQASAVKPSTFRADVGRDYPRSFSRILLTGGTKTEPAPQLKSKKEGPSEPKGGSSAEFPSPKPRQREGWPPPLLFFPLSAGALSAAARRLALRQ